MQEVRRTWLRLNAYWKATKASNKWKLIVFDAIIRSKLLYGLETIHITKAVEYKGLRKMLGMSSTFISRAITNRRLLEVATATAYPKRRDDRKIIPFSIYHQERRSKLLGHVLRCDNTDPLRQVSFVPESAYRVDNGKKRPGGSRQTWLHYSKKIVYEETLGRVNYSERHVSNLVVHAR